MALKRPSARARKAIESRMINPPGTTLERSALGRVLAREEERGYRAAAVVCSLSRLRAGLSHMEFWSLFQRFGSHRFVCPNDAQGIGSRTKQNRSGNGCCVCPTGPGWKRSMHRAVFPYAIPLPARAGEGEEIKKPS